MQKQAHIRILPSEITPRTVFEARRDALRAGGALLGAWAAPGALHAAAGLGPLQRSPHSINDRTTPLEHVTGYNNFYEFGTSKQDPAVYAHKLPVRPWTVSIEGLVHTPRTLDIDRIMKLAPLEERIYRLRCVEGWSMVVPWVGIPLSALLKQVEPLGSAKYVEFESFHDAKLMSSPIFNPLVFPYIEGLRLDEAMHPLTLLVVGLYGDLLPKQNGAPLRLAVPWKYGFKSAKSIVRIRFTDEQPLTSWNRSAPHDFGFYSNVNPLVSRERYDQRRERRLGELAKRDTLMFNGYADAVSGLYTGMDLVRAF
ncbi:oxidoreductase molybdopterin binding domain protein [Methyloversatilis sp. RAC08]|uniref:protein-methionine-sulfoxide reductase catalytic subunit MsrP n=1 Tax=Methyloversatilis sp. RAC08 TaxID=1842540 RepID=UPI00083D348E|nr:protein-methionine-sulfoxide reductase catalytic subunit MsrP [Methyloversatilis sp. RAC08]AOF83121.1 oxidoreductase molybdopterin binding domain protein [Methyloversatilis sp. RAC08]